MGQSDPLAVIRGPGVHLTIGSDHRFSVDFDGCRSFTLLELEEEVDVTMKSEWRVSRTCPLGCAGPNPGYA